METEYLHVCVIHHEIQTCTRDASEHHLKFKQKQNDFRLITSKFIYFQLEATC